MPFDPTDKAKLLYDAVSKDYDLGTYDEFQTKLKDPTKRKAFFDGIGHEYDLGDYNTFNQKLGYDSQEVKQQFAPVKTFQDQSVKLSEGGTEPINTQNTPSREQFLNQPLQAPTENTPSRNQLLSQHKTPQQELSHFGVGNQPQVSESTNAIQSEQTLQQEQTKQRAEETQKGIDDAINKMAARNANAQYGEDYLKQNIKQQIQDGKLVPQKQSDGTFAFKQGADIGQSFVDALTKSHQQTLENNFLANADKNTKLEYLNRIRQHPETRIVQESNRIPTGIGGQLGNMIGENTELMEKGTIGALAGGLSGATGGASMGTFGAMAQDFTNSGYAQGLMQNYNTLKEQNPKMSDEEALDKAEKVAPVNAAVNLATGAILSKASPEATEGLVNAFKQTIKSSPKVLGATALGSVAGDVAGMAAGEHKSADEILSHAGEATENMAVLHGLMAMPHIVGAALNEVLNIPSNVKPQVENVVASMPREEVKNFYQEQEQKGTVPEGTTDKVIEHLNNFDESKKTVDDLPLTEEQKATVASRINEQKNPTTAEPINPTTEEKPKEESPEVIQQQTMEGNQPSNEPQPSEESGVAETKPIEPTQEPTETIQGKVENAKKYFNVDTDEDLLHKLEDERGKIHWNENKLANMGEDFQSLKNANEYDAVIRHLRKTTGIDEPKTKYEKYVEGLTEEELRSRQRKLKNRVLDGNATDEEVRKNDVLINELDKRREASEKPNQEQGVQESDTTKKPQGTESQAPKKEQQKPEKQKVVDDTVKALSGLHDDVINDLLEKFKNDYSIASLANEVVKQNKKPFIRATDEQVNAVKSAKTPKDVLKLISNTTTDQQLKSVADVLLKNIHKAPFLEFNVDLPRDRHGYPVGDALGSYGGGKINVTERAFWQKHNLYFDKGLDAGYKTVLHEFVHAFTLDAYRKPKSPIEREFKSYVDKAYSELKGNSQFKDAYGFKSPEEFISEVLTNPEFRYSAPIYKSGIIDKIVEFVAKIFGYTKNKDAASDSRFEKVKEVFNYILNTIPNIRAGEGKKIFYDKNEQLRRISEAYHKAKADGSNPELVKAVEDALSEKQKDNSVVKVSVEKKNTAPKTYYQGIPKTTSFMQGLIDGDGNELVQGSVSDVERYKKENGIKEDNVHYVDLDTSNPNSLINKFLAHGKLGDSKNQLPENSKTEKQKDNSVVGETENKPFESNEHGKNFYDANNLVPENTEVEVGEPNSINRDYGRGGGKMYDEITVSSKKKFYNKILKEEISHHVYIIDRGDGREPRFGVSSKVHNLTVNAKTYDDALKVAKTFLAIDERDPNSVLNIRNRSENKVYDFSEKEAEKKPINTETDVALPKEETPPAEPPKEPPVEETTVHSEYPKTILTHRGLQEVATEIGGEDVTPRERESRLAQLKEADNTISEWQSSGTYDKNINDIIDRAKKGHIDEIEQKILANHLATVREERRAIGKAKGIDSKEFKDKTAEVSKVIDAAKVMRSKAGGLLGDKAFGTSVPRDYSSPTAVQESVEHVTSEPINASQQKRIEELTTQYATLKKQADDLEKQVIELTDKEINGKTEGSGKKPKQKTHTDYVKERQQSFKDAREALRKLRSGESGLGVSIPLVRELAAVAPHMAKVVKSLIDEGIDKLEDIVDVIHDELSKDIVGLRRRDVIDLVSGEHLPQKEQKELNVKYADLKKQSKLVKKLEDLQNGLPKDYDAAKDQSPEVKKLEAQIKKVKKDLADMGYMKKENATNPLTAEEKNIKRLQKQLDDLQQGKVKEPNEKRELSEEEKDIQDQIFEEKKKLGLVSSKVKDVEEPDYGLKITAEEKKIEQLEKEKSDLENGIAKQKKESNLNPTPEQKEKIAQLNDDIADLKKNLGVLKSKQEKPLTEEEQRQEDEKELEGLQKQFENKKSTDKKFTPQEASDLWNYAKKNYLDKKVGLYDAMKQTGLDTGLTFEQVNAAFQTPKTKPVTDAAWLKQHQLRKNKASIDNFIENSNKNPLVKVWKAITRIPKAVTTAIHGHVFPGTHYSMGFLTPQDWGIYFKSYAVSAKNAYGSDAFHEQEIQRITSNKNYPISRRAGLANDVERTDTDDFENAPKIFGKIGKTGTKGFLGLKDLRQNLFDRYFDALPKDEQTDKTAEAISYLVNSATLASNIKIPAFAKEGLFSAGMESARWGKVFKNPAMALAAASRITAALVKGTEIKPEDKVFVKIWGSRVGQQLATMAGMLALNAYIQSKVNPKNPVNLTDPTQSDYLNFKAGDQTVDLTGGGLGIKNFLLPITQYAIKDKNYKKEMGDVGGKVLQYGRNKLSPFYGDVADVGFGTDWAGNPTPFSNKTPSTGKHTLTWSEYLAEKAPIFASDALQNMFASAEENGLPKTKTEKIVNQIINVGLTGGLGLHNHPSYQPPPTLFTEEDKQDPTFKYFIDKGMSLPEVADHNVSIKDKKTYTEKDLTEYPKETQQKFDDTHKVFLKQELQKVKSKGYVYTNGYKDKDGNMKISTAYSSGDKRVPLSKLNTAELAEVLHFAQTEATKKTKIKIFGTD